ncbi:glucan 1,4-alpha-maltotetraohydrolase domain-containing protein [Pseudomonas sp. UMAB-40]|uniref:glucan 1,4-alpha-maltotetraohydrolase domain-containing protein n=1 Tax=Pseudomonas sp. UMAB-40 TaxID=1365407 RepID=UPI001C5892EB|nr:glucan 1,4-alpha-maltotetraohydrolase domain-containing protein [Pseudomonas sp. UMAB-40]
MKRTSLLPLLVALVLGGVVIADQKGPVRNDSGEDILLQGFHWNSSRNAPEKWYAVLTRMAGQVRQDGFTAIWMPPLWLDTSSWENSSNGTSGGGEGYFWRSFEKNSQYGTDEQLKQAAKALNDAGVKVVYDVVPNHMSDINNVEPLFLRGRNEWRHDCPTCDKGDAFLDGKADLNTDNPRVFETFSAEFITLRNDYGAQGLRFDFVRGYAPENVDRWMRTFGDQQFCVGELWKGPGEYPTDDWRSKASWQDALKDWSDRSRCTVFDFALKERMQNGSIAEWRHGLNGNPDPNWRKIAVTFVDNHDTGYSPGRYGGQHHWALPEERRNQAYAYILSSPGTPSVYWPDMYDWQRGDLIRQLIKFRKEAGIKADSPIRFQPQYSGLVATTTGARKSLVIALDSNLTKLPPGLSDPVLNRDDGKIRIWSIAAEHLPVSVRFTCDYATPQPGKTVYAVGSSLELGAWDPRHAVALNRSPAQNQWSGSIDVPADQGIQWKCIERNNDSSDAVRWQPGPNVSFTSGTESETRGTF